MGRFEVNRFHWFLVASAALITLVVAVSGVLVGRVLEGDVLAQEKRHTAQVVLAQARSHLTPSDFEPLGAGRERTRFEVLLHELPQAFRIKVFDRTGTIIWSNERRLIGQRFPDNLHVSAALQGEVAMVLEAPKRAEHTYERTKGYVAEAYVPITFPGSPEVRGVIETYTDVTEVVLEIRRAQRVMWTAAGGLGVLLYAALALIVWRSRVNEVRAVRQLEAKYRLAALGRLAAGVAHELRNPLSVVVGRVQLLQAQTGSEGLFGPKLRSHLDSLGDAANRMTRIVSGLSMYSKPPRPEPTSLNVGELLLATRELVAQQAKERGVGVTDSVPEGLPPVMGDRSQLMQVLLNLAQNAVEAMAATGGQLTLNARVLDETDSGGAQPPAPRGSVCVEVSDTGPGIPADVLQKIWGAFYTTKPEGTGLGLSIVRSLVAQQPGATIRVETKPGQGTTFILTMPVANGAVPEARPDQPGL